ncbi:DnaD domain protein, partial [Enterococcus lactis]|nr:DnaD domain protein [Enterococcus lactis]
LVEDHFQPVILKLALRDAVLIQTYSFNYVDRILLSWERKNLRTKQQVEEDQKRRKQQLLQREVEQPTQQEELPKVSLRNWL